jgi:hypothetical protein
MAINIGQLAGATGQEVKAAPPFPVGSLNPPLSVQQRNEIRDYLESSGYTPGQISAYIISAGVWDPNSSMADHIWIDLYNTVAGGGGFGSGGTKSKIQVPGGSIISGAESGINAVGDFFKLLTQGSLWVRIGEGVAAAILLAVGVSQLLSSSKTVNNVAGSAATAAKYIK